MAKLPQSEAAKRRRKNIAEGAGIGAVMGGIGTGHPIGAAIGAVVGTAMGIHKNVRDYNRNLRQEQFNKESK